jgi:hypothetical protein
MNSIRADLRLEGSPRLSRQARLVLISRKPDAEVLQLVRLGSHSELGL